MSKLISLLLFPSILLAQIGLWRIKRTVYLPYGLGGAYILCADTDHNGFNEIIFRTRFLWQIYEHFPFNNYQQVYADTGAYPYPPGIETGNFEPYDVGFLDQDGFTDLVGPNIRNANDSLYNVVTIQESPDSSSYPESLSWWYKITPDLTVLSNPFYITNDLDDDTKKEILAGVPNLQIGAGIWENVANNQNELVWHRASEDGFSFAYGDFDEDGHKEFVTAGLGSLGRVFIYENTGDNQYELVRVDTVRIPNGSDVFSGQDVDGDGKPEFLVGFAWYLGGPFDFYLYMWEATGNNSYERTLIDRITDVECSDLRSKCGDIDGDGVEEVVWSIGAKVMVYSATGNNQFQQVWLWRNDHGGQYPHSMVNIYDMNGNGYNEIVVSGENKTSIFEVEAVRVLSPNGGENLSGRSQVLIKWHKFFPPRCDSLSLFYSLNNGRTYETIATGIPGSDSTYLWTVPNIASDSGKVKIITYGPGWQFDESDRVFRIVPVGVEEQTPGSISDWSLTVSPNPASGRIKVCYDVPSRSTVRLGLYDAAGRLVALLASSTHTAGRYRINLGEKALLPRGVYLIRLETNSHFFTEKVIVAQ
ncbi:T9SS type A sorting domain-containing protein [candidate division WOR-3 bacterium]|nr:T9SS type A sorting domain-containing protein [candidate division WOR-3 bacterium]